MTDDTRTFPVEQLIQEAQEFFGVPPAVAAGALYAQTTPMTVAATQTLISAFLGTPAFSPRIAHLAAGGNVGATGGSPLTASGSQCPPIIDDAITFDVADGSLVCSEIPAGGSLHVNSPRNPVEGQAFTIAVWANLRRRSYVEGKLRFDQAAFFNSQSSPMPDVALAGGYWVRSFAYSETNFGGWLPCDKTPDLGYVICPPNFQGGTGSSFYTVIADTIWAESADPAVSGMGIFSFAAGQRVLVILKNDSTGDWNAVHFVDGNNASPLLVGSVPSVAAGSIRYYDIVSAGGELRLLASGVLP